MTKFDDTYILTVAAVPAYWLIIMIPYAVSLFVGSPNKEATPAGDYENMKCCVAKDSSRAALARRCVAAHQNSWEGFTIFLAAIIAGFSTGASFSTMNATSLVMVIARLLLVVFYMAIESGPLSFLRSLMFFAHMGAAGVMWGSAIYSADAWDNSYIMIAIAAPVYWVLVMAPAMLRARAVLGQQDKSPVDVNAEPRKAAAELANSDSPAASFVRRATAAHENGWENYTLFFISAGLAAAAGGNHTFVNVLVVVHLAVRALFVTAYLLDSPARPLFFALGSVCVIALWVVAFYKTGSSGYIAAIAAVPVTWFFVMLPFFVRLRLLTSVLDLASIRPDPRKAAADFSKSEDPRAGLMRRAQAAHVNGWENLAVIGSAVIVSLAARADVKLVNGACIAFMLSRALFVTAYLLDLSVPRVFFYTIGVASAAVMWVAAISEM